jgi:hypothetical protein
MTTNGHKTILVVAITIIGIGCGLSRVQIANAQQPTQYEGYLRGHADVGRAQAAVINAQATMISNMASVAMVAAKACEEMQNVRTLAIDTNLKATKAYFEKRKMYADYRAQFGSRRADGDELARRAKTTPTRLNAYQIDPAQGKIFWPAVLKRDEFAAQREQLEALFSQRKTQPTGLGSNFSRQARSLAVEMRDQLKQMVRQLAPADYIAARQFLDGLVHEVQQPAPAEGTVAG